MTRRNGSGGNVVPIIPRAIEDALSALADDPSPEKLAAFVEELRHRNFPTDPLLSRWIVWRKSTAGLSPVEVLASIAPPVRAEALRRAKEAAARKRKQEHEARKIDPATDAAADSITKLLSRGETGPYGRVRTLNHLERIFEGIPADLNPANVICRYLDAIERRHLMAREPTTPHTFSNSAFSALHTIALSEIAGLEAALNRTAQQSDEPSWSGPFIEALFRDEAFPRFFDSLRAYIAGTDEENKSASGIVRNLVYVQCLFAATPAQLLDDYLHSTILGFYDLSYPTKQMSSREVSAVQIAFHWLLTASAESEDYSSAFLSMCQIASVSEEVIHLLEKDPDTLQILASSSWSPETICGILHIFNGLEVYVGFFDDWDMEDPAWNDNSIIDAVVQRVAEQAQEKGLLKLSFEYLAEVHEAFDLRISWHSNWYLEFSTFFVRFAMDVQGIWADVPASDVGVTLDQYRTRRLSELATENGWTELSQAILGFWFIVDGAMRRPDVAVDWGHAARWLESERRRGPSALIEYSIERAYEFRKALCGEDDLDVLCLNAWRTPKSSIETLRPINREEVELRQIDAQMKLRLGGECASLLGPRAWATLVDAERKYKLLSHHLGVEIETSDDLVVLYAKTIEIALADRLKPIVNSEAYRTAVGSRRPVKPALGQLVTLLRDHSKLPEPVQQLVDMAVGDLPKQSAILDRLSALTPIRNRATHDRTLSPGAAVDIRAMLLDRDSGLIMKLTKTFRRARLGADP